jgi:hypothetical protein
MPDFAKTPPPPSIMNNLPHNERIKLAIDDLESQTHTNFAATAKNIIFNKERLLVALNEKLRQEKKLIRTLIKDL